MGLQAFEYAQELDLDLDEFLEDAKKGISDDRLLKELEKTFK